MKQSFMRLVGGLPKFPPVPDFLRAEKVGFADIGARGGPPANWLLVGGKIVYICFEPDPLEARKIEQELFPNKNLRQFEGVVVAKALDAPRHLHVHSPESINHLAKEVGFTVWKTIYNSAAFQFWGSEQYAMDMPLMDTHSYGSNRRHSVFTDRQIADFNLSARNLNATGSTDQVTFFRRKS